MMLKEWWYDFYRSDEEDGQGGGYNQEQADKERFAR
jgi:hypothetical protein